MKNFFDCKDEKITEKAFSQSLIVSIVSILLCMAILCSLTYAWFSEGTVSNDNKLVSGQFGIDVVSVIRSSDDTEVFPDAQGRYALAGDTYTVTVKTTDETSVKGYCVVEVNGNEYRTEVIVNDQTVNEIYTVPNSPFTFQIEITDPYAVVKIESRWGVPADPVVQKGGVIAIAVSQSVSE